MSVFRSYCGASEVCLPETDWTCSGTILRPCDEANSCEACLATECCGYGFAVSHAAFACVHVCCVCMPVVCVSAFVPGAGAPTTSRVPWSTRFCDSADSHTCLANHGARPQQCIATELWLTHLAQCSTCEACVGTVAVGACACVRVCVMRGWE